MRRRFELIVYPRLRDLPDGHLDRLILQGRLDELGDATESVTDSLAALHDREHLIATTTAEFLLPQEEIDDDDPDDGLGGEAGEGSATRT